MAQRLMRNSIHYSAESRRDLDEIWDYIVFELQNSSAAERVVGQIMDSIDRLGDFAEMGAPLFSVIDAGVFYRAVGSDVYIDRILYGRSNYMSVLFKDIHHE